MRVVKFQLSKSCPELSFSRRGGKRLNWSRFSVGI